MATPSHAIPQPPLRVPPSPLARRERRFFGGMALALTITVFVGFAPSYYLKAHFGAPPELNGLLHAHGLAFSLWMVVLVAQTSLVAAGRTDLHRRLGVAGVALAVLMTILGSWLAIERARQGLLGNGVVPPLQFLTIPLVGMVVFPALVGAALWFRRQSAAHKRFMLVATVELATAAIARWPGIAEIAAPPVFFGIANLFVAAILAYDLVTLKRVHWATAAAGLFLVASQVLRLAISDTTAWLQFAGWLTG